MEIHSPTRGASDMKKIITGLFIVLCAAFLAPVHAAGGKAETAKEIYYQVMVRSFYDSNGDGIGDLRGLATQLDYLQELGVTAIWIMPVFASPAYFNYYADDFFKIDPALGTMEDFRALCTDIHRRGMKILLDMETQYITKRHEWFADAEKNPQSRYGDYISWTDREENIPLPAYGGFTENYSYDGTKVGILSLNMNNPDVVAYQKKIYAFWLDPDGDGNLSDGVDGYRMDHVMDNLDNAGVSIGLLERVWKPVVEYTRKINPSVFYLVEPSDWGSKWDATLRASGMDGAFNIPLRGSIVYMAKDRIVESGIRDVKNGTKGKLSFTVIENHDNNRFASEVSSDPAALRLGAVLNLTLPGVPCLYYGQELGMKGEKIEGLDDGNDIPRREAFRWFKDWKKKGMAVWYKIPGREFWEDAGVKLDDGTALEEQRNDPSSLYAFYKKMIAIRKKTPALQSGEAVELDSKDENVLAFGRKLSGSCVVIVNLSDRERIAAVNLSNAGIKAGQHTDLITGNRIAISDLSRFNVKLAAFGALILE
jgi:glycosidase